MYSRAKTEPVQDGGSGAECAVQFQRGELWEALRRATPQAAPTCPAACALDWARCGPRLRTSNKRIRSSNSTGAYMPLGRKRSARVSRSWILTFPENRMAGV